MMWRTYLRPATLAEALDLLDAHAGQARLIAGGTDVLVELSRGVRPTETLIDLTAIPDLRYVTADGDHIILGALATHNDVLASADCRARALPLAQACWEVGAPQIRTRATVAGNLITASPANDTITPLIALGADVTLASRAGERTVPLDQFYQGVRRTVMAPNELLREIRVPMLRENQRGIFLKLGLRRAQAISVINAACVLTFDGETITDARIALGSVAPTIIHATAAEEYLRGKRLDDETRAEAGRLAAAPRSQLTTCAEPLSIATRRLAGWSPRRCAASHQEPRPRGCLMRQSCSIPAAPDAPRASVPFTGTIETTINGAPITWPNASHKTLLNALREDAGLTGTKEGCAEGECGACTVWLDGAGGDVLPRPGGAGARRAAHHHRGPGEYQRRRAASAPARLHRARRGAVRLLHPRHADGRRQAARRAAASRPRRGADRAQRQHLPLHRLPQDPRRRAQRGRPAMTSPIQPDRRLASRAPTRWAKSPARRATPPTSCGPTCCASRSSSRTPPRAHPLARYRRRARASRRRRRPHRRDVPYNAFGLIDADQPVLCGDVVRFAGDKVALVVAETQEAAEAGARSSSRSSTKTCPP